MSTVRILSLLLVLAACDKADDPDDTDTDTDTDAPTDTDVPTGLDPTAFIVWSPDFVPSDGMARAAECENALPDGFECDNPNPEIAWANVPAEATHLILLHRDDSNPGLPYWAIWDIEAGETGLDAGISGVGATSSPPPDTFEATNLEDFAGYYGSCPLTEQLYTWELYAVDAPVGFELAGTPAIQLDQIEDYAMANSVGYTATCHLRAP